MKKLLCVLAALTCAINLAACGSSSDDNDSGEEFINLAGTSDNKQEELTLHTISRWLTREIWNDGFCDISWYVKNGTNATGGELDIDFLLDNLKYSYSKKAEYDEYINSLDDSIEIQAQLINAWNKTSEQIDILYNKVTSEKPRPKDATYEFNTDLYIQYHDKFEEYCNEIKDPAFK
jgi:hypothetical protein